MTLEEIGALGGLIFLFLFFLISPVAFVMASRRWYAFCFHFFSEFLKVISYSSMMESMFSSK